MSEDGKQEEAKRRIKSTMAKLDSAMSIQSKFKDSKEWCDVSSKPGTKSIDQLERSTKIIKKL